MEKQSVKYLLIVNFESGIKVYKFLDLNEAITHYKEAKGCKLKTTLVDNDGNVIYINC